MNRRFILALEVLGVCASLFGFVVDRFSRKENRQAQALERIATAAERLADDEGCHPISLPNGVWYRPDCREVHE